MPLNHHFWGPIVHDNHGAQHKARIPIDFNHDNNEIIGYANHFNVTDDGDLEVRGALVPYRDSDRATEILAKAEAGIPWEASINFAGDMSVEIYEEGEVAQVNGREFSGPLTVVREWQLRGVAVTPYGYDASTSVELSDHSRLIGVTIMSHDKPEAVVESEVAEAVEAVEATDVENSSEAVEVEAPAAVEEQVEEVAALSAQPYIDAFGLERGAIYFAQEVPFPDAQTAEIKLLRDELDDLRQQLNASKVGASEAVSFSAGPPTPAKPGKDSEGKLTAIPVMQAAD